jgi:hypothetical protein
MRFLIFLSSLLLGLSSNAQQQNATASVSQTIGIKLVDIAILEKTSNTAINSNSTTAPSEIKVYSSDEWIVNRKILTGKKKNIPTEIPKEIFISNLTESTATADFYTISKK